MPDEINKIIVKGEVLDISPVQTKHPHLKWQISLKINEVISGNFDSPEFLFNIHSPTKSNIVISGKYIITLEQIEQHEYKVLNITSSG
jgi:hypothetical protein